MRHLPLFVRICLPLVIAGCAVGSDYRAPTPAAPADFAQWHGGSDELLAQRPTSTAPIPDWSQLHDPVLDYLLSQAAEANADVQTAALRLAESRALRQSAAAGLAPQLNIGAGMNRQRLSENGDSTRMVTLLLPAAQQAQILDALAQPYDSYQAGLDFAWELDLWGRVRRGIEAADAQIAASQALLAQARWSVQAEVARRYFELRGAQRQITLNRDDITAAEESLTLVRALADGGVTTDLDVTRQQSLLSDLRARLPQLLAQKAATLNALTLLLAQPPGALQTLLENKSDLRDILPSSMNPHQLDLVQRAVAQLDTELRETRYQIAITRDDMAAAERSLALIRAKHDVKADVEAARQQSRLSDLNARQQQLLEQEASATKKLALLLPDMQHGVLPIKLPPQENEGANAWPDLSLGLPSDIARRRPDIMQAEAQLHAATANTGVAVADFYPRLTLGASFGFQSLSTDNFGAWGTRAWSIGPSLQLPLFDNGRRNATLTVRQLQQQEAAIAYHQTVLQAWHEIDNALNAYSAERMRNQHLIERERSSRDALTLAKANYENGLTNFLTELDARRTLITAQRERADSDIQLGVDWVGVIKALGPEHKEDK